MVLFPVRHQKLALYTEFFTAQLRGAPRQITQSCKLLTKQYFITYIIDIYMTLSCSPGTVAGRILSGIFGTLQTAGKNWSLSYFAQIGLSTWENFLLSRYPQQSFQHSQFHTYDRRVAATATIFVLPAKSVTWCQGIGRAVVEMALQRTLWVNLCNRRESIYTFFFFLSYERMQICIHTILFPKYPSTLIFFSILLIGTHSCVAQQQ